MVPEIEEFTVAALKGRAMTRLEPSSIGVTLFIGGNRYEWGPGAITRTPPASEPSTSDMVSGKKKTMAALWCGRAERFRSGGVGLFMSQCRYRSIATGKRCTAEASTLIDGAMPDGTVDTAGCCQPHQKAFLEEWDRMQRDAARLKAKGLPKRRLSRLMCARVDRGAYEHEPSRKERQLRAAEEGVS